MHIQDTQVQLIRDAQLGSVNISRCNFTSWVSLENPVYEGRGSRSTANPPSLQMYNMESSSLTGLGARKRYGCNISDSSFEYAWDVDMLESAVSRTQFIWAGVPTASTIPAAWRKTPPVNPSLWVNLQSDSPAAGFKWTLSDSLMCMRPDVLYVNGSLAVSAQVPTIVNGSTVLRTRFLYTNDTVACPRLQ